MRTPLMLRLASGEALPMNTPPLPTYLDKMAALAGALRVTWNAGTPKQLQDSLNRTKEALMRHMPDGQPREMMNDPDDENGYPDREVAENYEVTQRDGGEDEGDED